VSELSFKKPVGVVVGLVSAAMLVSAVAGIAAALMAERTLWYMLGFEIITLVAAIFGVLLGMGRFAEGPGLGLLCVMAAVAVGSVLGDLSTQLANPIRGPLLYTYGTSGLFEVPLTGFMVGRFIGAAALGACGAWLVLARHPKQSFSSLGRGAACGVLFLALLAGAWKLRPHLAAVGTFARTLGAFAFGVIAIGLLAATVHFTVGAFQLGRLRNGGSSRAG